MVTWFAHRTEVCRGAKDTFIDLYLSIQTTFCEKYNRMNDFYIYLFVMNKKIHLNLHTGHRSLNYIHDIDVNVFVK